MSKLLLPTADVLIQNLADCRLLRGLESLPNISQQWQYKTLINALRELYVCIWIQLIALQNHLIQNGQLNRNAPTYLIRIVEFIHSSSLALSSFANSSSCSEDPSWNASTPTLFQCIHPEITQSIRTTIVAIIPIVFVRVIILIIILRYTTTHISRSLRETNNALQIPLESSSSSSSGSSSESESSGCPKEAGNPVLIIHP